MTYRSLILAAMVLGSAGQGFAQNTAPEACSAAKQKIIDLNNRFDEAYNKGDAAGVAALFTEDAVLNPPVSLVSGREAITQMFQDDMKSG